TFDDDDQPVAVDEKPLQPKSNWAITGLYFYDDQIVELAKQVAPSARNQLEITSIIQAYLDRGALTVERFGRGFAWLDTGTFGSLVEASELVRVLEHRQGVKIGCPEEIAWRMSLIDDEQLERLAQPLLNSGYGDYLLHLLKR
ncbi:MAG: sugar phosphate nucleotidyltransferase, partial [Acidimicrobiia bacterium]|nr:sugar phosphate nucleotidyltransferase [Acidimicrobiia bacterium]